MQSAWHLALLTCPTRATRLVRREVVANSSRPSFTGGVLFELNSRPAAPEQLLVIGDGQIPILFKRHPKARRYVLRLDPHGRARVTIPRSGSLAEARRFTEANRPWLEKQWQRFLTEPKRTLEWHVGSEILLQGHLHKIESLPDEEGTAVRFGMAIIRWRGACANVRPLIEKYLWKLAARELPGRVWQLAAQHALQPRRVCIRNQKSRWGSCSRTGTISLNWRLIQMPPFVSDYIILHELMHLRQMNHSPRFWREVEQVCPDYRTAELWLKQNKHLLER